MLLLQVLVYMNSFNQTSNIPYLLSKVLFYSSSVHSEYEFLLVAFTSLTTPKLAGEVHLQ